jgi:DNA-binding transcriptional LysR family regulator
MKPGIWLYTSGASTARIIPIEAVAGKAKNVKRSFMYMNDLNNFLFFARIVEHGSLTSAAESLGVAKSMLSQRLSALEKELGVELIRRSSRRLQVTEIGKRYYAQCDVILKEVANAAGIVDSIRRLPRGKLRISCPVNFSQGVLAPILGSFLRTYPDIEIVLDVANRPASMLEAGHDVALLIAPAVKSSSLVATSYGLDRELLVASQGLVSRHGMPKVPADLKSLPSAAPPQPADAGGRHIWHLAGPGKSRQAVHHVPRLLTEDLWVIRESALAGGVIAALPPVLCRDALEDGRLVRLLPEWTLREQKLYLTYPSKRGLTLAARALVDLLSRHLRNELRHVQDGTFQFSISQSRAGSG